MSETIIPAQRWDRIWVLITGRDWRVGRAGGREYDTIPIIGWAVGQGAPVPITALGRIDPPYVIGFEGGWVALPGGETFYDSTDVVEFLRSRHVG